MRPVTPQIDMAEGSPRRWSILAAVSLGVFLSTLDGGIVNIALPVLMRVFDTSFPTVQWVVISYLTIIVSSMLLAARLGDLAGRKRCYAAGVAIFTLASGLCAAAPSIGWLIALRALQGTGAVLISGLGVALVAEAFPPRERGRALGLIGSVVSVGIALGPTLGGLLLGLAGWHWIFLVNLPVGVATFVVVWRVVPESPRVRGETFDLAGAITLFAGLSAYTVGMTLAQARGPGDPVVLIALAGAAAAIPLFVLVEKRSRSPMLDLSLFRHPVFGLNLLMGFLAFVLGAALFLLPFYLDLVRGFPPARAGLLIAIVPVAMGLVAPWAGAMADRWGSRRISFAGLVVLAGGALSASTLRVDTPVLGYLLRLLPFGIGLGLFQAPNNRAIMQAAPRRRYGIASGLLALSRTLGQVSGLPLMGALFALFLTSAGGAGTDPAASSPEALVGALGRTLRVAAGLALVNAALAAIAWRRQSDDRA